MLRNAVPPTKRRVSNIWSRGLNTAEHISANKARYVYHTKPYQRLLMKVHKGLVEELKTIIDQAEKVYFVEQVVNIDINDHEKALSSGWLLKQYLNGTYPTKEDLGL